MWTCLFTALRQQKTCPCVKINPTGKSGNPSAFSFVLFSFYTVFVVLNNNLSCNKKLFGRYFLQGFRKVLANYW